MTIYNSDGTLACICHEHKPVCNCVVASPPIASDFAPLSSKQLEFLALHIHHAVTTWRWHWLETMLRATAGTRIATLWRDDVDDLVQRGLMEWGHGCADVRPTQAGRVLVEQNRKERA